MENQANLLLSVSDFVDLTNQTLEFAYSSVVIEGEVSSFKVNQGKFVFFDIKDDNSSVGCFMMVWQLRLPIEDGMRVIISAAPKLTKWGKFSLTVRSIRPSGEGSLKKSFDILKSKLEAEGLFAAERKRALPDMPEHVAVISSTQSAGYADFVKILDDRWGGIKVDVAHVQVQGESAPDQMIKALKYFNTVKKIPQVIILIRGGGSADDLSAFNDEMLVREIASSRVPTIVGVGHEIDESLADLVADVRASTPSNAAQILVPDRSDVIIGFHRRVGALLPRMENVIRFQSEHVSLGLHGAVNQIDARLDEQNRELVRVKSMISIINPKNVLKRGYAIVRGSTAVGELIDIETKDAIIKAEVKKYDSK